MHEVYQSIYKERKKNMRIHSDIEYWRNGR